MSIPNGPSALAVKEAAWGLARYAAISQVQYFCKTVLRYNILLYVSISFIVCVLQDSGLVPIVEPEIMLDGEHCIDRTYEVAEKVWSEVFFYLSQNNVMFEGNT